MKIEFDPSSIVKWIKSHLFLTATAGVWFLEWRIVTAILDTPSGNWDTARGVTLGVSAFAFGLMSIFLCVIVLMDLHADR
jgi:hypothetical protein